MIACPYCFLGDPAHDPRCCTQSDLAKSSGARPDPLGVIRLAFQQGSITVQHADFCEYGRTNLASGCKCGATDAEIALRGTGP